MSALREHGILDKNNLLDEVNQRKQELENLEKKGL